MMVVDDLHTRFGRTSGVKSAAKQFIERSLGANDLMAVIHTAGADNATRNSPTTSGCCSPPSTRRMGRKLDSATANKTNEYNNTRGIRQQGDPLNDPDDMERGFNARTTLDTLRNVAEWFGSVRGRRKAILFVSEGIDYDINDMIPRERLESSERVDGARRDARSDRRRDPLQRRDLRHRSARPDRSRRRVDRDRLVPRRHLARRRPGSLQNELRLSQDSLRTLSEETGGFAVVNKNDFATAFERIVEDNSSYYVLAYYPPDPRPAASTRSTCAITRPGLTVRARKAYLTPKKVDAPKATRRATIRRRRKSATRSTARCRSAA